MRPTILFILQDGNAPTNDYRTTTTSGVATSTHLIAEALRTEGICVEIAGVSKPEEIAHVARRYSPEQIIVETLWVNPEHFRGLVEEFPDIRWAVREHSESCFRVLEPHAFGWIIEYMKLGVEVISNSARSAEDVSAMALAAGVDPRLGSYGPNIYPIPALKDMVTHRREGDTVHIGCFGAVRLMKNHITQALAAIMFGDEQDVTVHFHINSYDIPGYIDPVINNLREMFSKLTRHKLVEHGWMCRADFLELIREMHIVTQVSFTETFNIVAADAMYQGVPIIVSDEISWLGSYAHRDPNSASDIARGYRVIHNEWCRRDRRLQLQRRDMEEFSTRALVIWANRCFE